jgi:hypothetical protein
MNDVRCPRCGGTNPSGAGFCGACGNRLPAQEPAAPADTPPPPAWQPAANQAPPPNPYPPPPNVPPPFPGAYPPPPGSYPPLIPGIRIVGSNTKWAVGLGIVALFCCGPFAGVPGLFLAKKDMDDIAAGRAPQLDPTWASGAFYLNIIALALFVLGFCVFWGIGGRHRF